MNMIDRLQIDVQRAIKEKTQIYIQGGQSQFRKPNEHIYSVSLTDEQGILAYEPTELVVTVKAGTSLRALQRILAQNNQMLAFEPPAPDENSSIGGCIACNRSGPRRPFTGSARDFVLGVNIVNGLGEYLKFGGQVMKNVAGYDVSRLMAGSAGSLAIITQVSLKVLPLPRLETTIVKSMAVPLAIQTMATLQNLSYPLSGLCHIDNTLYVRLSGNVKAVLAAKTKIGGDEFLNAEDFWQKIRDRSHPFFTTPNTGLWRILVSPATPMLDIPGQWLIDWGGAQRWLQSERSEDDIRLRTIDHGGLAHSYGTQQAPQTKFHRIEPNIMQLFKRIKTAFDPHGVFYDEHYFQP